MQSSSVRGGTAAGWGYKLAAAIIWAFSCFATYALVWAVSESAPWAWIAAVALQLLLTLAESAVWRGSAHFFSWTCLGIDIFTNIGGVYVFVVRLDRTDSWLSIMDAVGFGAVAMNGFIALVLSIALGAVIAAAPEMLWRQQ